jgi:hypothetical protein
VATTLPAEEGFIPFAGYRTWYRVVEGYFDCLGEALLLGLDGTSAAALFTGLAPAGAAFPW